MAIEGERNEETRVGAVNSCAYSSEIIKILAVIVISTIVKKLF